MEHKTLLKLLENPAFKSETKMRFAVNDGFDVAVLLATQTTSSISNILHMELMEAGCTVTTDESTYLLPLASIFAIRIDGDKASGGARTGFLA